MLKGPWNRQRASAKKNKDHRFSGRYNLLQQILLPSGETQVRTRGCFSRHFGSVLTQGKNHQISLLRGGDRIPHLLIRTFADSGSFGVEDIPLAEVTD